MISVCVKSEQVGKRSKLWMRIDCLIGQEVKEFETDQSLTLSGRLPEDSMQKILLLYILCLLSVEVTEFHFGV